MSPEYRDDGDRGGRSQLEGSLRRIPGSGLSTNVSRSPRPKFFPPVLTTRAWQKPSHLIPTHPSTTTVLPSISPTHNTQEKTYAPASFQLRGNFFHVLPGPITATDAHAYVHNTPSMPQIATNIPTGHSSAQQREFCQAQVRWWNRSWPTCLPPHCATTFSISAHLILLDGGSRQALSQIPRVLSDKIYDK